jgi:hypothetical protein
MPDKPIRMDPAFHRHAMIAVLHNRLNKPITAEDVTWFEEAIDSYANFRIKEDLVLT